MHQPIGHEGRVPLRNAPEPKSVEPEVVEQAIHHALRRDLSQRSDFLNTAILLSTSLPGIGHSGKATSRTSSYFAVCIQAESTNDLCMGDTQKVIKAQHIAHRLWATLEDHGPGGLDIAVRSLHVADVASALEWLTAEQRVAFFQHFDGHLAAEVLEECQPEIRQDLLESCSDQEIVELISSANADDAVYFLDQLPAAQTKHILGQLDEQLGEKLSEQYQLPDDSAGHIMTRDVIVARPFDNSSSIFQKLRNHGKPIEGYIYIVNAEHVLINVLPLRVLILANDTDTVDHILKESPHYHAVGLETDQETVADMMQRYHLRAVPVIDADGKLCGQVTWDDAADVIEAEAEEDMLALAGTTEDLDTDDGVLRRAWQRLPYLLLTAIGGFAMAHLIHGDLDGVLSTYSMLLAFLPMVPALGGNIGIQCSTVTVRSIATGEIRPGRVLQRTVRELGTGTLPWYCLIIIMRYRRVGLNAR